MNNVIGMHGSGEPRDNFCKTTNRLTSESTAVVQIEAVSSPLEYILQGLPHWSVKTDKVQDVKCIQVQRKVSSMLGQVASSIISWNPVDVWLKQRRAVLLGALRSFWEHDPTTLAAGVDALLCYLCANDEWSSSNEFIEESLSMEIVSLRKKSGICIVQVSKRVPHLLVPWLGQLSDRARQLLSSELLLSPNKMHLFEFLSCVASAVEDPDARASFVANVLSSTFETLESIEAKDAILSTENLLKSFGVTEAATNPSSVTDAVNVRNISRRFGRLYSAFNQFLSVGRRCHEAAMKRPSGGIPLQNVTNNIKISRQSAGKDFTHFPDEGSVSISDLAQEDPFVPLWPKIMPSLLQALEATLKVWHPEYQAVMLANKIQRYVYAISDDEVYLSRKQDSLSNGGVFGKGGTGGTVVSGWDRRSSNLAPRWSGWFNELRNVCFQLLGLMCVQRAMFSPDISIYFPELVRIISNQKNLMSMEHRHMSTVL